MDLSGDLDDPRGAESGVSWTRFDSHLTLMRSICQMQDIVCIGNSPLKVGRQIWSAVTCHRFGFDFAEAESDDKSPHSKFVIRSFAALPPDVRKAFGLPSRLVYSFGATPQIRGRSPKEDKESTPGKA